MGPQRFKAGFGVGGLAVVLSLAVPAYGTGCTESPPFVCTTTSESFFWGLMSGQPTRILDFETLPNGQPSVSGTQITPSFNYTELGVTFSAPAGTPIIGGPASNHDLRVFAPSPTQHTWLQAELAHPSFGVGIYFNGTTTLTAFGLSDNFIASQSYGASGGPWFIGIYSEIPIGYMTADRGSDLAIINDFVFSLIPEPTSVFLLMGGTVAGLAKRRGRIRASHAHM